MREVSYNSSWKPANFSNRLLIKSVGAVPLRSLFIQNSLMRISYYVKI